MTGLADVQLHRVDSVDDAAAFMRWLGERRPILAVDTETTGLKPWRDHIRLVQFGDATQGWTIRWDWWQGVAQEALSRYAEPMVFHNAKFDVAMLRNWGNVNLALDKVHDTALMARILDNTGPRALKDVASRLVDPKAAVAQAMLDKAMTDGKWDWATIPYEVPVYSVYAAMDTVLTAQLYEILAPQVQAECPNSYDLERAFQWVIMRLQQRGSMLDHDYTEQRHAELTTYMRNIEAWCEQTYGVYPGSDVKVINRLQQDNVEFTKYTDSGSRYSLDKDVLEGLQWHPLAQAVAQRRKVQKVTNTYLWNFLQMEEDGILRPDMDTMGALTGRMSMELMQTLPRRSEEDLLANIVRNCIRAREGHVLMMCDFDQIEMRMLAHLAQDPALASAFTEGDFFANMARQIFNDMSIVKGDVRRQRTKNAAYSKAYGAGVPRFSATAGIPVEEGEAFMQRLDLTFPGIRRFQNQVGTVAQQRLALEGKAYVRSPLTGRKYYPKHDDKIYALVNYLIQGGAAEVLKMKVVELDLAGVADYLTLLVHDEVIGDVPVDVAQDVAHVMQQTMNDANLFSVPLTAAVELGYRWGEKGAVKLHDLQPQEAM